MERRSAIVALLGFMYAALVPLKAQQESAGRILAADKGHEIADSPVELLPAQSFIFMLDSIRDFRLERTVDGKQQEVVLSIDEIWQALKEKPDEKFECSHCGTGESRDDVPPARPNL
jgi:hypothetical protein